MTTLLLAEHDNKSLRDTTARLLRHMQGQRPHVELAELS